MSSHVREIRLQAGLGQRAFYGEKLAEVNTDTERRRRRWIEMALYRDWEVRRDANGGAADPLEPLRPKGYVLHLTGRSLVYHLHNSRCNTGLPEHPDDLPETAKPCDRCRPPALRDLAEQLVDLEEDRFTIYACADARQVMSQLQDPHSTPGTAVVDRLSAPAQRLLQLAAEKDDGIADATDVVEWL